MRPVSLRLFARLCAVLIVLAGVLPDSAQASCGAVSCFVVIGSQQQVPMAGLLTVNMIYSYTPSWTPEGQGGNIPFANQGNKQLILANLNSSQIWTHVKAATLDMNYGLTERLGIQLTVPFKEITSLANLGTSEPSPYSNNGLGDMRATLKYNVLPTLRSMVVLGFGVDMPTGTYQQRASNGQMVESTLQLGRGNFGLIPSLYQTYEIIPHRVNQFSLANYRHTFRNSDGYQFGDELNLSLGFNLIPLESTPWLVITQQVNYRWMQNDAMEAALYQFNPATNSAILLDPTIKNRAVPTTGSNFVAYSPGILLNLWNFASAYFIVQIPVYRDFNGNLEQQTSYLFGLTKTFQLMGSSS